MTTSTLFNLQKWLEKAGKKAWHEHDGFLSHPVAVKHHEEYFAGKDGAAPKVETEQPEIIFSPQQAIADAKIELPKTKSEWLQLFAQIPEGSSLVYKTNLGLQVLYQKVGRDDWAGPDGEVFPEEILAGQFADTSLMTSEFAVNSIKLPDEEWTEETANIKAKELFEKYKTENIKSAEELGDYFELLPVGSTYQFGSVEFTKGSDGFWSSSLMPGKPLYSDEEGKYWFSELKTEKDRRELLNSVQIGSGTFLTKPQAKAEQDIIADILKNPDIINIYQWQKEYEIVDKQQRGSTEGFKVLHKPSRIQYYVKFPGLERVGIEDLANRLYRLAGVPVAFSSVISTEKGFGIGSKWLPNAQKVPADSDEAIRDFVRAKPEILNNFVIDAWLANWDAVGLNYDNLVYSNGKVYRIDQGGSMMLRAQGETKHFGDKVQELDSMRDPEKAPQASRFFKYVEDKHLKAGASKLAAITDDQIKNVVSGLIGHEEIEKEKIANTLIKRRDYIVNKILSAKEREKKPCSPGLHRHKEYDVCHPIDRKHRGQAGFVSSFVGIDKVLSRVKDKEIRDLWQRAKQLPENELRANASSNRNLGEMFGFTEDEMEHAYGPINGWQSGEITPMIEIRGAINYLKGQTEAKYAQEQAYFLYEREMTNPRDFDRLYKKGIRNAKYYLPFIAATQAVLKKNRLSGFVELFRGIGREAERKLRSQYNMMGDDDILAIPHSGLSSFSTDRNEAKSFAGSQGITVGKQISVSDVWLQPSIFTGLYKEENEYLVDGDAVQLFRKDELIV